jgi:hypothetical protein
MLRHRAEEVRTDRVVQFQSRVKCYVVTTRVGNYLMGSDKSLNIYLIHAFRSRTDRAGLVLPNRCPGALGDGELWHTWSRQITDTAIVFL